MQEQQFNYVMKPIAFLKSCYPDKFGVPRQPGLVPHSWAELKINSELQPRDSLQGLSGYSHVWLVFVFHLNKVSHFHAKVHPPRLGGETMGLFATRTPHRPNPIGLSLVELIQVTEEGIVVAGADLVDGTPILDIKPYLPQFEAKPEARGGWAMSTRATDIQVHLSEEIEQLISNWASAIQQPNLKSMIVDTLKQDPRPVVYRGFEKSGDSPYRQQHAFRLFNGDIHFQFTDADQVEILKIFIT